MTYTPFDEFYDIALVRRGVCTNTDKLTLALQYNASAIIIFNEGNVPDRTSVFIGSVTIPAYIPGAYVRKFCVKVLCVIIFV